jgi:hypothetical protein
MNKSIFIREKIKTMSKKIRLLCQIHLAIFALVLMGCGGCGGVRKDSAASSDKIGENEIKDTTKISKTKEIEKLPIGVIPPPNNQRYHKDSIVAWNKRASESIKQYTILPDANTKYFTIDPITGAVNGCPLIKFYGVFDYKKDSINLTLDKLKFKKLLPEMEKAWIGTKDTSPSIEFPEGEEHYPRHGYFSANDEYVVVPDGHTHGGTVDRVYFFDKKGKLLNKFILGKHLQSPTFGFNKEKTFFILSNGVGPEYYFFYPDGRVFKKGNYHEITFDKGTSYGMPMITANGKYYMLNNNLNWIYSNDSLIKVLKNEVYQIDEKKGLLIHFKHKSIFSKYIQIEIIDFIRGKTIYTSNEVLRSKNYKFDFNNAENK